jgi:pyruvate/2-oxoglutarate dehydrogenase complex dihydrolipoamide dehydrogenase (E3) component
VDVQLGTARIRSPYSVEIRTDEGTRTLTTRAIVIATGARPLVPEIPGIDEVGCRTSDDIWELRELPRRLLVLGGGAIGCELTQAFARFGSGVTLVEMAPRLLPRDDPEASDILRAVMEEEGVDLRTGHRAQRFAVEKGERVLYASGPDGEVRLAFDVLLCAVGRVPNTRGFGLEELRIPVTPGKTVETDAYLQTLFPNIYACGDVAGPYQFTHTASHQAWYAAVNALFGRFRRFRVDYRVIPRATFTDPEIASVGLTEEEAAERGIDFEVTRYGLDRLDRAIVDEEARGFVKILTAPGKDRILGATIVGSHGGELIAELVLAMKQGIGLNKLLGTIHVYPTWTEANKQAAGAWRRAHTPARVLALMQRYHAWVRG